MPVHGVGRERRARTAVDPGRPAVGQRDVGRAVGASASHRSRAALVAHHQRGVPDRASYVLAHTRKCRRSSHASCSGPSVQGSTRHSSGSRKRDGSTASATTTGRRAAQSSWRVATVGPGSASTASSIVTTGASCQGAGTGSPAAITTPATERGGARQGRDLGVAGHLSTLRSGRDRPPGRTPAVRR